MTTVLDSLNAALHRSFTADERVILLGEDLLDPYGGAFKVTRGLSDAFPSRVLSTPISEAGFTGLATGMALRGLRPVVEIMFGDFVTLIADQVINHAAKFRWMYGDQGPHVPVVIRAPMGGRRGYGPTHSQALEKLYLGVPGLRVLVPCALGDPGDLLYHAILDNDDPSLFIENKLLYLLPVLDAAHQDEFELHSWLPPARPTSLPGTGLAPAPYAPTYTLTIRGAPPPTLTLAAYGYMAELARQAMLRLAYEQELFCQLVVPTQLSPFVMEPLLASLIQTGALLTIEESTHDLGWGAEVLARAAESLGPRLQVARRLAALNLPVPSSPALESVVLPSLEQIFDQCLQIAQNRYNTPSSTPGR
jgi:pyruvate/2-oxoglutarate/acetoin dehydrogenase E1 component